MSKNERGVVGGDIGHSAVKCKAAGIFNGVHKRVSIMFPSIAIPALKIADEAGAERAKLDTVMVDGNPWFYGETARIQSMGAYASGLTASWIETKEHTALFLGMIQKLEQAGMKNPEESLFILGLPTILHATQKERLKQIVSVYAPKIEVLVAPQPMGALYADMLTEDGNEKDGRSIAGESIGVIEIGFFTTDFLLLQHGDWTEQGCGSSSGVCMAAQHLAKLLESNHAIEADLDECQATLINGRIANFGQTINVEAEVGVSRDILADKIIDDSDRLFSPIVRKLSSVIIAGGGAPLVYKELKAKWPHANMITDHRLAIADGFCRLGSGILLSRSQLNTNKSV